MLGGHSLVAFQLMAEIEDKFGKKLPLQTLMVHPTIAALAKAVGDAQATAAHKSIVALKEAGSFPALFMIPAAGSHALTLMMFAKHFEGAAKVYGLEYPGMNGYLEPYNRMESLASFFAEQIRAVQPDGPYYLGGQCLGTVVAFETAKQLEAQGQKIGAVAILDGRYPDLKPNRKRLSYFLERLTTLHRPEGRAYFSNLIKNRKWQAKRNRRSDVHSRRVRAGLKLARAHYTPSPLTGRGLAILSSDSQGIARQALWERLFSEFKCLYIPNTSHRTIFNEEHRPEIARLLSQNIYD
jgi:thioesterase domain-containing protein